MRTRALSVLMFVVLSPSLSAQTGRVERITRGDTTVVRTTGNGMWGAPHAAVELQRIGGSVPETAFGKVRALAVLRNGSIAVFDEKSSDGPIIRLYDSTGKFLRNVSRVGAGPGEYGGRLPWPNSMPDGRLLISDAQNHRANFYTINGKYLSMTAFPRGGFASIDMIRPAANGNLFVMTMFEKLGTGNYSGLNPGFVRYDTAGHAIDSLKPWPSTGGFNRNFGPAVLLDGTMIRITPERMAVLFQPATTSARLVIAELNVTRVRYNEKEREEILGRMSQGAQAHNEDGSIHKPTLPELKSSWAEEVLVGGTDRVWLRRNVAGISGPLKTEPDGFKHTMRFLQVYDAFQPDGTFLGEVSFPDDFRALAFIGDFAWGTIIGKDDEQYLVKYRVR